MDQTPIYKWVYGRSEATLSIEETVKRAKNAAGTRRLYNALTYNCEHFATECKTGHATSKQVTNAVIAAGGGSTILVSALTASSIYASKR